MSHIPEKPEARESNVQRRVAGGASELGKVGRMAAEPPRRRKSKSGKKGKGSSRRHHRTSKVLINWLILLLSIAGVAFACALLWSLLDQEDPIRLPVSETDTTRNLPADKGLSMINRMLSAETPEDLEILICPGKLNSQQAFEYLQMLRNGQQAPPTPKWIGILDSLSVPLELVSIRYSDTLTRSALFTPDSQGEWKLDFDAYAQLCIPEFSSLLDEGDQEGLVRVHIMQDHYFNNCFGDESEWDCYLLIRSSEETSLFGYCKRGSKAHSAMQALHQRVLHHTLTLPEDPKSNRLRTNQLATRATLHIKRPPEAEARQFEITRVVSDDWVISDKPFDERLAEKKTK